MLFACHPKILQKHCLPFFLRVKMAPGETENSAYAEFWGDKSIMVVMVFSGAVNWTLFLAILSSQNTKETMAGSSVKYVSV